MFPNCFWTDIIIFTSFSCTIVTYGLVDSNNNFDHFDHLILQICQKWPSCATDDTFSGGDTSVPISLDNFHNLDMMDLKNELVAGARVPLRKIMVSGKIPDEFLRKKRRP